MVQLAKLVLTQSQCAQDRKFDYSLGVVQAEDGSVNWSPPAEGFIKINTDVALF